MVGAAGGRERIVIAMSGGVDSSTAAAMLVDAGHDVVGVTLRLYDASGTAASIGGRCCGPRDIEDARATAAHLGIPHHVIDESAAFSAAVIDDFVAEYRAGRTPNPCVRCNERIKFGPLLSFVDAVGASALATGHYARLMPDGAGRASPWAARATPTRISRTSCSASDRRSWRACDFRSATRRRRRCARWRAGSASPTPTRPTHRRSVSSPTAITSPFSTAAAAAGRPVRSSTIETGVALGAHAGTHGFTVGQRRGLPASTERRFVLRIDGATGEVRVGPRDRLGRDRLRVSDVRWLDPRAADAARRCAVQIRHRAVAAPAWIEPSGDGATLVRLDEPAFGVAPGQAAVFYDSDDRVLGGGWIDAA